MRAGNLLDALGFVQTAQQIPDPVCGKSQLITQLGGRFWPFPQREHEIQFLLCLHALTASMLI